MRRWLGRWFKTQWTAIPLAFLIVTAIELWRLEDSSSTDRKNELEAAANVGHAASDDVVRPASSTPHTDKYPTTKSSPKIVQQATGAAAQRSNIVSNRTSVRRRRPWRQYGQADIAINTSGPVVNPHPFNYLINSPDLCQGVDVFLLNYVHTAVDHFTRRARIRRTWALQSHYQNVTIRTVFFVGLSTKAAWFQDALYYEAAKYGDIVQKDFIDTYK